MAKKKTQEIGDNSTKKTIDEQLDALELKFGAKTANIKEKTIVSTGSYYLNKAMGTGGYPVGKVIEIYGPESSGKSTIVLHAIAEFQKVITERKVAYFDFEYSFDKKYATAIGVDVDALRIEQPDNQEQGFNMLEGMVEQELVSLVVIDSQTAAIPRAIIEGNVDDATMALQARNNSLFFGKIKGKLDKHNVLLLIVSQLRATIGGMHNAGPSPTGGNALKFYADMRFKVWKELDKPKELNSTHIDVVKNKCSEPFGQAIFDIVWGMGIDSHGEILDMCVEKGIIIKSGAWYSYNESNLGCGRDAVKQLFSDNPEMFEELKIKALSDNIIAQAQ